MDLLRLGGAARVLSGWSGDEKRLVHQVGQGRSTAKLASVRPSSNGDIDSGLAEIVEEFTQRLQAGEPVELEEYVAAYPQWGEILRDLLGDLRGLAALDAAAVPDAPASVFRAAPAPPALLGDFAIGDELGRGGMGVVDDLNRFLDGRTIKARPATPWQHGVLWSRRNPAVAGLIAALVLVFFAGFVAVAVLWWRANVQAARANATASREAPGRSIAQPQVTTHDLDRGPELAARGDVDLGLSWMAEALRTTPAERPKFAAHIRANLPASVPR